MTGSNGAKRGESPSDGSRTFEFTQLADALELIHSQQQLIHQQQQLIHQQQQVPAAQSARNTSVNADNSVDTTDTSTVFASRPSTPSDRSPRDSPPPLEPVPDTPPSAPRRLASPYIYCPRHQPKSSADRGSPAPTAKATPVPVAPTAVPVSVSTLPATPIAGGRAALPMGTTLPAIAAGGCQDVTLPAGSRGLVSGPATPSTSERWYAVTRGRSVGVFEGWANVSPLVTGVGFCVFQRYASRAAALAAYNAALYAGTVTLLPWKRILSFELHYHLTTFMGRRAKYYTLEARAEAAKAAKLKYVQSPRGKQSRATYNHKTYEWRQALHRSPFHTIHPPNIPLAIVEFARRPSRVCSHGFNEVLTLGIWEAPYLLVKSEEGKRNGRGCDEWREILNLIQFDSIVESGRERWVRVDEGTDTVALAREMEKEIGERMWAWEEMKRKEDDAVEADVALEWAAKILCVLAMDIGYIREGRESYLKAYRGGTLPWMRMNII